MCGGSKGETSEKNGALLTKHHKLEQKLEIWPKMERRIPTSIEGNSQ